MEKKENFRAQGARSKRQGRNAEGLARQDFHGAVHRHRLRARSRLGLEAKSPTAHRRRRRRGKAQALPGNPQDDRAGTPGLVPGQGRSGAAQRHRPSRRWNTGPCGPNGRARARRTSRRVARTRGNRDGASLGNRKQEHSHGPGIQSSRHSSPFGDPDERRPQGWSPGIPSPFGENGHAAGTGRLHVAKAFPSSGCFGILDLCRPGGGVFPKKKTLSRPWKG